MPQDCTPVQLPLMGEGVHEATVVRWLKKQGERIEKDEPLIEVSTDKVDTEIAAPATGFLIATYCQEGSVVAVDEVLGFIGVHAEVKAPSPPPAPRQAASSAAKPSAAAPAKSKTPRPAEAGAGAPGRSLPRPPAAALPPPPGGTWAGSVRSSPLCRKLAREHGIDLHEVRGSGLYGRITRDDVLDYLQNGGSRIRQEPSGVGSEQAFNPWGDFFKLTTELRPEGEFLDGVAVTREKMSKIRRLTAEHMLRSVRVSPHVTTTFEIDLHAVDGFKQEWGPRFQAEHGFKLTYTSFFIYAAVKALEAYPLLNAAIDGDEILLRKALNIGCAVAIEAGLIVPVIKDASVLSFFDVAVRLNDLVQRARDKKLTPQDVQGGTFSITNPGMFGSLHSQPIISQPQVAIMSIGAIIKRPVVAGDSVVIHPLTQVGLTFDHRLVDGEGGAKFLAKVKQVLENFSLN